MLSDVDKQAILKRLLDTRDYRARSIWNSLQARMGRARSPSYSHRTVDLLVGAGFSSAEANAIAAGDESPLKNLAHERVCDAKTIAASPDYAQIRFLQQGQKVSWAVGRLVNDEGSPGGTAFMISPTLLMTAGHALPDDTAAGEMFVQFDFEVDENGDLRDPTSFALAPELFFHANTAENFDYAVVALGDPAETDATRPEGVCALPSTTRRHHIETFVNIIQHPFDLPKSVVVRENRVLCVPNSFLYYTADVDEGSSGAPVFNDQWQLVGLNRYGTNLGALELTEHCLFPDEVGEGVPIMAIVADLTANVLPNLDAAKRALLQEALGS